MSKNRVITGILLLLSVAIVMSVTACSSSLEETDSTVPFVPVFKEGSYGEYLQNYARASTPDVTVPIDVTAYSDASDNVSVGTVAGVSNVLLMEETGYVEFEVEVPVSGLYSLGVTYNTIAGKNSAIERAIYINGAYPFNEARSTSLDRVFIDDVDVSDAVENADGSLSGYFDEDVGGNQMKPSQIEKQLWVEDAFFKESSGYYSGALQFYLEQGTNTIRLASVREPSAFSELYLVGKESTVSYDEYLTKIQYLDTQGTGLISKIQAEYPIYKSDAMLYANYDKASPATQPVCSTKIVYNTIGGDRWSTAGQWVEYTVDVPTEGAYKIVLRARQNTTTGRFVSREITVNGETPTDLASNIRFLYDSDWQMVTPTDQYGDPLLFHFKQGENTIRIKAVLGDMADLTNAIENVIAKLTADYRKILAITGSSPDKYRDYDFDLEIPEVISDLKAQGDILSAIYDQLVTILGGSGQQTAILSTIISQLYKMSDDPTEIASQFKAFSDNIGTLGTWLVTMREQPLEIDYILIAESKYDVTKDKENKGTSNFFSGLGHQLSMFFSSFFTDYNSIGGSATETYDKTITVWTTNGRDKSQILRQIIDRRFTPDYEVNVDFSLVPGSALLPSILAGRSPDVALNIDSTTVINYASRNVLYPLNTFEDYGEVVARYHESATVPVTLEKEEGVKSVYGLPETQSFLVMFYRSDVLAELGYEPPKTWDEVYKLMGVLNKRYMQFAAPDFGTILYQNGGSYYKNEGSAVDIDTENAIQAFIQQTDFYTMYKCPVTFDFANRFRFGEMPVGIQDYSFVNTVAVFAPEIRGLWSFTTVPGVANEDGSINNTVLGNVVSCVMMNSAKDKETSWEFMKWWTDVDAQTEYGREVESLLGSAARYNTANREAAARMPWSAAELEQLNAQWDVVTGYPEQVGGYYLTRYLGFAHTDVVVNGLDPRETILEYSKVINDEIIFKRNELDIPYYED